MEASLTAVAQSTLLPGALLPAPCGFQRLPPVMTAMRVPMRVPMNVPMPMVPVEPVMMVVVPVDWSPDVSKGRINDDRRRRVVDRPRRWGVIIPRRGSPLGFHHLNAGICARSRREPQRGDGQCNQTKFFKHDRSLRVVARLNQRITAKLQKSRTSGKARRSRAFHFSPSLPELAQISAAQLSGGDVAPVAVLDSGRPI